MERVRKGEGRQRIIDTATELFITRGYAATSTRDIARQAGLRQPSIYTHFQEKSDILLAVMQQGVRASVQRAEELTTEVGLDPARRLEMLVDFDVRMLCSGPWNVALLGYLPEVRADEDLVAHVGVQYDELRAVYRTLVAAALAETSDPRSPEAVTDVVFTLVEGVILRRVQEPALDGSALAESICEAVRTILRPPAQPEPRSGRTTRTTRIRTTR